MDLSSHCLRLGFYHVIGQTNTAEILGSANSASIANSPEIAAVLTTGLPVSPMMMYLKRYA